MNTTLKADLYRYGGDISLKGFLKAFFMPGFRYTYFFRKGSSCKRRSLGRIFYGFMKRRYTLKYGIQIPLDTTIGDGFYIGHFGNIIVNPKATIGKYCNIAQGVTIGQSNRGKSEGVPTIKDKVWIGANSVLVGNIIIGNNVLIAPNSFVNFDVPDNSVVISNKCKIIENEIATAGYIEYIIEEEHSDYKLNN